MICKKIFPLFLLLSLLLSTKAQSPTEPIDVENFLPELLQETLINNLNTTRWNSGMDSLSIHEVLFAAAINMSDDYRKQKKSLVTPEAAGGEVKKEGGTTRVEELATEVSASKAKVPYTYAEVAQEIADKVSKSAKNLKVLNNPKYFFVGIGSSVNSENNKIYVSLIFGGIDAFNAGSENVQDLPVPFSTSKKGLKPFDEKLCKSCEKFVNLQRLQDKLYLDGNNVVLEYENLKEMKKFFKNTKDGLAVDIVQKAQYPCNDDNIFNYNLNSRGYLLKPLYQKKLFKANELAIDDPKATGYKAVVGVVPDEVLQKVGNNYEFNLLIIINKRVCKTLFRYYLEDGGVTALAPLNIFPDTVQSTDPKRYVPKNEDQVLEFKIPFEQGKTEYKPEDIKPFLEALNEPKFIINEISIIAHSSLEGDSAANAKIQTGRAESIVKAMEAYQSKEIAYKISTDDSWKMFQDSIRKTEYAAMAALTKEEVRATLQGDFLKEIEPLLAHERFAQIEIKVTYDVSGNNEENFVISNYRKVLEKKDVAGALKIQRYIVEQIDKRKYDPQSFLEVDIPKETAYASLLVNKKYIENKYSNEDAINIAVLQFFEDLNKTMSANDFVSYNTLMAKVKSGEAGDKTAMKETQAAIQAMYTKPKLPQRVVDALNLEHQFNVIEKNDTLESGLPNEAVQKAMDQIKKIFNIEAANWKNSLTLAYVFVKHNDFAFAQKILEPYVNDESVNEQLLFTYLSISARHHDNVYARSFRVAMQKAGELNSERYCQLFGYPKLTFQMMDNPLIKKQYCEVCGD